MILLNNSNTTTASEWRNVQQGVYVLSTRLSATGSVKFEFRHTNLETAANIKDSAGDVTHTVNDMTQVTLPAGQIRAVPSANTGTITVRVEAAG